MIIEIDGEQVEVSDADYQQFLEDQRHQGTLQLFDNIVQRLKDVMTQGNQALIAQFAQGSKETVQAIGNIPAATVAVNQEAPIVNVPDIHVPKAEVFLPEAPRIKEIKVSKVTRDDQDLISGCTLKVIYH